MITVRQNLWLHNLYIRYSATVRSASTALVSCSGPECNLWMTDVRLQGGNIDDPLLGGLHVSAGSVYADSKSFIFLN